MNDDFDDEEDDFEDEEEEEEEEEYEAPARCSDILLSITVR